MERTLYKDKARAQSQVIDMLRDLNGHPIHAQQIGDKINLSGSQVDDIVLELRSMGFMICGDDAYDGYYMGTLAQVKETVKHLKDKIKLMTLVVNLWDHRTKMDAAEREQKASENSELPGQQRLEV